jgi:hypothetical protein
MNISPIAFDDAFTAVGNTALRVGSHPGKRRQHRHRTFRAVRRQSAQQRRRFEHGRPRARWPATTSPVSPSHAVTNGISTLGGTFNIFSDGSFNYISEAGDTGVDTFAYTITDAGIDGVAGNGDDTSSTATVSITLSGQVWYVDNTAAAGGDGTSWHPFDSLSDVSGATGPDVAARSSTSPPVPAIMTAALPCSTTRSCHGAGTALTVSGYALAVAGTDPTIVNTGATNGSNGVVLASGNTLTGFTVGNTGGYDIANTATATVGTLTISNVDLTGTGGLFRADSGGALSVTFDTASTTGTAANINGIQLGGALTGSFTATTGTISGVNATGATDVLINGGTETVDIGSSITGNAGGSVDIGSHNGNVTLSGALNITGGSGISVHNNTGGTILFSNASKVVSTGASNAVDLDTNTGTTVNFTNGGLDLDTTTAPRSRRPVGARSASAVRATAPRARPARRSTSPTSSSARAASLSPPRAPTAAPTAS